jgi:hypothetical protein
MPHPITVPQGPALNRGLVAALGIGVDLSGVGAGEWTSQGASAYSDPLDPDNTGWGRLGGFAPVSTPTDRETELVDPRFCGVGAAGGEPTSPWEIGETHKVFDVAGPIISCSTLSLGGDTDEEALKRANDAHRDLLWRAIERELWTGAKAQAMGATGNRYLAHPDTEMVGLGLSLPLALYLLEQRAAACTSRDERVLIHCTWPMLEFFACEGLLQTTPNSDRYYTSAGSLIVAGTGYTGQYLTPGEDEGEFDLVGNEYDPEAESMLVGLYATTRIRVMLGKRHSPQGEAPMSEGTAVQTATNDVTVQARQKVGITLAGCVFGATVAI